MLKGLVELGYVEGSTIHIDYRYADGEQQLLAKSLMELIALKPRALAVAGAVATRAAAAATKTIPIVSVSPDPVKSGFAQSLNQPGGNVTGMSVTVSAEFAGKWIELGREMLPNLKDVAFLYNASSEVSRAFAGQMRRMTDPSGIDLSLVPVTAQSELEGGLKAVPAAIQALIVDSDALFYANSGAIVSFVAWREFVDGGGLISYGTSIFEAWRSGAKHVDMILKGADPANIPIEPPTKFELVLNSRTARTLGLAIPPSLLVRADETVE